MPKISSYSVTKKLEVIKWHKENGCVIHRTAKHFSIDRKRIREWIAKEETLIANNHGKKKNARKLTMGRKPLSEELDDELFEFFQKERENGLAVTNKMLSEESVKIARSLGILTEFKASSMYLQRWKNRFHVSMRKGTNESQKLPVDHAEAIEGFLKAIRSYRIKNNYSSYNICNMDQTMVRFDEPYGRTNEILGTKTVRIVNTGCRKRGFTVALAGAASGHKFPAFLILKEPTGRIPARVYSELKIPSNVKVTCSKNGWMTSKEMEEWLSRVWGENVDDVRRLLVLDRAPIHTKSDTQEEIARRDTDCVLIPAGCTSIVQPADVSWMMPFKNSLRKEWAQFIRKKEMTPAGNLKKPSRQDMINFISTSWVAVSEETIKNSFKCCGISVELDGSEDGLLNSRLSEVDVASGDCEKTLDKELAGLLFDSDSDDSFDGFSD